ncbi:mite allergen Der p 3-like [Frankliniella occidentalis]|uniref:Mite allergen Der p 3-like n=1 Tax=Frankliniella occidentalis TaxID=133901 RepID=A0A9C6X8Y6_FRAOC|nr:mite allergen Der p 3-like [Frankliniella occidentalis]
MLSSTITLASLALFALAGTAAGGSNTLFTGFSVGKKAVSHNANTFGEQKIIGGVATSIKNFPYMAAVTMYKGKTYVAQCGGSILDKYHILSAAHCFDNRNPKAYYIRVGSDYWRYKGQGSGVKTITVHPKYNKTIFDYDVAVIKLIKPITINNRETKATSIVKLNTVTKADTVITLIGWGYTDALHSKPIPGTVRSVDIAVTDRSECESDYSDFEKEITPRMICGMTTDGEAKDSCQGDSGGPVINKATKQQIGIVSWGMGCAQMGSPGVFTNLANPEIRSFINSAIKK